MLWLNVRPNVEGGAVRGAAGATFALHIEAYYNDAGSAAWPLFTVKPL